MLCLRSAERVRNGRRRTASSIAAFVLLTSCTGVIAEPGDFQPVGPDALDPERQASSDADAGVRDVAGMDLPCDVVNLLNSRCTLCHSDPPRSGAAMPMLTLADLVAPAPTMPAVRVIDEALTRMLAGTMPPQPLPPATQSEVSAVQSWIEAGLSSAECGPSDPGFVDPGPVRFEGSGAEVFAAVCATCHGSTGEGTDKGYELRHPARGYSTFVVRNGRPGVEFPMSEMSAYDTSLLSVQQLEEIWDFLSDMPQPTTGEGLFLDYCANCHGADALGGVVDEDVDDEAFIDILEQVREGNGDNDYAVRLEYMPSRTNAELSDSQLLLIADYLSPL
jgi:mono/diheme cytochrome c family protein